MSRSKATKRRKVWVTFDECETGDDPVVHLGRFPGARPMVERLPGDVVLSREDVAELRELVQANLSATRPSGTDGRILALLRGRR